ncbi:MAG: polymerase [Actinomycetota bacterium]
MTSSMRDSRAIPAAIAFVSAIESDRNFNTLRAYRWPAEALWPPPAKELSTLENAFPQDSQRSKPLVEPKLFDRTLLDVSDCCFDVIGHAQEFEVFGVDHSIGHHVIELALKWGPERTSHENDREIRNLRGLDESQGFEQFVNGSEATGHHDECVGVLDHHHLANEEVLEVDADVEIVIGELLLRQLDVAADALTAGLSCPSIRGFHDSRTASRHDGQSQSADGCTHLTCQLVFGVAFTEPRGTEDGDTRTGEMEVSEARQHFPRHTQQGSQFPASQSRAAEKCEIAIHS